MNAIQYSISVTPRRFQSIVDFADYFDSQNIKFQLGNWLYLLGQLCLSKRELEIYQ